MSRTPGQESHGPACAQRIHGANECTCGKAEFEQESAPNGAPWETSVCIPHSSADAEWQVCEVGGGDCVAVIVESMHGDEEARANLIAAAPEMLALLEEASTVHDRAAWLVRAADVLAKARGDA